MNKFLKFVRDPIWQAVGVLVAVVIALITFSKQSPPNDQLAIIKTASINFSDYLLPSSLLKLNLPKANQSMEGAVVDYFMIINRGGKPILPTDYTAPLSVKSKSNEEIFLVDSCAQPNDPPIGKASTACKPDSFISSTWQLQNETWIQDRSLLNSTEKFCVIVIRKPPKEHSNTHLEWGGRIIGVRLATYDSFNEYAKSQEKNWTYYIQTSVRLEGAGPYWFVALQLAVFYATLVLARQAHWLRKNLHSPIWPVAIAMLLSTSTAEILVDIFINLNFNNLSPLVWPLLLAHVLLIAFLIKKAINFRLSTTVSKHPE